MSAKPTVSTTMASAQQAVIWQACSEDGITEPAILVQSDSTGLLILTQEGRDILIQPSTLPDLFRQLKRLVTETN
jgi:hypothetical protein